jgi:hypothetical protein
LSNEELKYDFMMGHRKDDGQNLMKDGLKNDK